MSVYLKKTLLVMLMKMLMNIMIGRKVIWWTFLTT